MTSWTVLSPWTVFGVVGCGDGTTFFVGLCTYVRLALRSCANRPVEYCSVKVCGSGSKRVVFVCDMDITKKTTINKWMYCTLNIIVYIHLQCLTDNIVKELYVLS